MHLDHRSPLIFDTRELGRAPGAMSKFSRTIDAPDDLGTEVIAIPPGTPVVLDLRAESVMEGVLVSGTVTAEAIGACVRCLDPVHLPVQVGVQELFAYADRVAHADEVGDDDEDLHELDGDLADLEPVVRDAVVPALPFQPVCRVDCPGLCSECGARLADDPGHRHELTDPRWAALAGLSGQAVDHDEKRN